MLRLTTRWQPILNRRINLVIEVMDGNQLYLLVCEVFLCFLLWGIFWNSPVSSDRLPLRFWMWSNNVFSYIWFKSLSNMYQTHDRYYAKVWGQSHICCSGWMTHLLLDCVCVFTARCFPIRSSYINLYKILQYKVWQKVCFSLVLNLYDLGKAKIGRWQIDR